MNPINEEEALGRMAVYCSGAERCISDVRKKLENARLASPVTDRILTALVKEGFIDEERFARSFVHDKLNFNHWGRIKISCELRMKNIPPSICRDVIEDIDCPAYQSMLISVLEKKKKSTRGKDDREVFAKLLRFAAGRGFERSETLACLRRMFQTIDYVGDDTE